MRKQAVAHGTRAVVYRGCRRPFWVFYWFFDLDPRAPRKLPAWREPAEKRPGPFENAAAEDEIEHMIEKASTQDNRLVIAIRMLVLGYSPDEVSTVIGMSRSRMLESLRALVKRPTSGKYRKSGRNQPFAEGT